MRELRFLGPGELQWQDGPDARLRDDRDVIVRPVAVARCDLDLPIAIGLYPMPAPFTMGHEMVGEVVDAGAAAGPWSAGDRVIVPFQLSCGECDTCARGWTNACRQVPSGTAFGLGPHGGIDLGGALADLVRVPWADRMLIPLPDGVDPVAACGIPDNVSDGYRCVAGPLARTPGAPVLVVGGLAASVGVYAAACAVALGAERVVYADHDAERLALAAKVGAEAVEAPLDELDRVIGDERFPITVDACVLDQGRDAALRAVAPCGTCTSVSGGAGATATLPLRSMYLKGVTYEIGRVHASATAPHVLDLVVSGRLDPAVVVTRTASFDDAVEAMVEPGTKTVFVP